MATLLVWLCLPSLVMVAVSDGANLGVRLLDGTEQSRCDNGACYPSARNLMKGRADSLEASSTCGVKRLKTLSGVPFPIECLDNICGEKFCVLSEHSDDVGKAKASSSSANNGDDVDVASSDKECFICNSSLPGYSHNISEVVDRTGWWQSANGLNAPNVTIDVNFNAKLLISFIFISFKTFRPAGMRILRSSDHGASYHPIGYFADDCGKYYPDVQTKEPRDLIDTVVCDKYKYGPAFRSLVTLRLIPRLAAVTKKTTEIKPHDKGALQLMLTTNIKLVFEKLHTLGDESFQRNDPDIFNKYYYAIKELMIRGICYCNGHAPACQKAANEGNLVEVGSECMCVHNTSGGHCERCKPLYNDLQWRAADANNANPCQSLSVCVVKV